MHYSFYDYKTVQGYQLYLALNITNYSMQFDFNLRSSFLLIFFVHTLVYSGLFFYRYKKKEQRSSLWMGLFLLLAALYISPWMLGFSGWYGHQPYRNILFYVPFQHLFLIGPVIFFYVATLFNPHFRLNGRNWIHFLPAMLYLLFCIVMVVYDQLIVKQYYFLKKEQDPDFDDWYQIAGYVSMITYFVASIKYYYNYRKTVEAIISNAAEFLFTWVRNFLFAFLFILSAWFFIAVFGLFYQINYVITWWYFLAFAIICYYIAIAGYSNAVEAKLFFQGSFFNTDQRIYLVDRVVPLSLGYVEADIQEISLQEINNNSEAANPKLALWKEQIEKLLTEEQVYLEPELTLLDIAKRLQTNISNLSLVINTSFQSNFNDLINRYRVNHFIALLDNAEHKKQTLLSLAFESGFNSKTTFNRAFKKNTGLSPVEYIKTKVDK